jgi:hypothetical protein
LPMLPWTLQKPKMEHLFTEDSFIPPKPCVQYQRCPYAWRQMGRLFNRCISIK